MNIILCCINNFQEYILTNIEQLIKLGHNNIFIITNDKFYINFEKFNNKITLVNINDLTDSYNFYTKTSLDKNFRDGFWSLTSMRFFYIYECMRLFNLTDVIHLENDVLIYYNCNKIIDIFDKNFIYLPFDTFNRNIASIMYIPNNIIFKNVLDEYDFNKNDMENFSHINKKNGLIKNFPIFPNLKTDNTELQFVSNNYEIFNCIFDAAAIGQYLGGVDPRNIPGNSEGFINETCVIKYNNYNFTWKILDEIKRPFVNINNDEICIFNLHIHCKNLNKFI